MIEKGKRFVCGNPSKFEGMMEVRSKVDQFCTGSRPDAVIDVAEKELGELGHSIFRTRTV